MSINHKLADIAVEIERHRTLLTDLQQMLLDLIEDEDFREDAWLRVQEEDRDVN